MAREEDGSGRLREVLIDARKPPVSLKRPSPPSWAVPRASSQLRRRAGGDVAYLILIAQGCSSIRRALKPELRFEE